MTWNGVKHWLENPMRVGLDDRQRRQGLFLSVFLLLCLFSIAGMAIVNVLNVSADSDPKIQIYIIEDITFGGLLLGLFFLNRRGYVRQAAYLLILAFLVSIAAIPAEWQTYTLLLYFLPIQVASFTVHPRASIPVALISIGLFVSLQISRYGLTYGAELIYLASLIVTAVISWFFSDRLEHALDEARQSEQKYIAMLEKNPFCIYVAEGSQAGRWVYLSPRIEDLLGFSKEEWVGAPNRWIRQIHPDDRQQVLADVSQSLTFGLPFHAEYRMLDHAGSIVWVSDDALLVQMPGQRDRVQGVLLDITARKRAEQIQSATYRISQAAFAAVDLGDLYNQIHNVLGELMHAENFFIALYDPATDMLNFPYFVDQFDEPPEPIIARHGLTEYILRTGKALFATAEKCGELVDQGEIADVGTPSVDWMGVPLMINNRAIGVMVVQSYTEGIRFSEEELNILKFVSTQVAMVIDRKRTEAALREVNQLTGEVISGVNTGIIVYDQQMRHLIWNRYMEQMTGLSEEQVLDHFAADVFPLSAGASLMDSVRRAIAGETISIPDIEYSVPLTGNAGWLSGFFGPHRNAQGEMVGAIAVINEISERKRAEETLRSALGEKEVLLREIHHRVKNNLQVMSSLISLQADTVQNPAVQDSFREMQARVRTMALIHEELYQAQNLSQVNFAEYIEKLASGLMESFRINPNVALRVEVEEVYLGVDTAIPCGLIVNELVTNAFKYAFPDNRTGEVIIQLSLNGDGIYRLSVQDNGIGLPANIDFENNGTLGLQLITILSRQLRARMQVKLEGGTCIQIEFSGNRSIPRHLSG
jgi:PAS domain S-box-containing protein